MPTTRTRRQFMKAAALGAVVSVVHGATSTTQAMEIKLPRQPATVPAVQVLTFNNQNKITATGSGTFVGNERLVITNFHVVGNPRTGTLYHSKGLVGIAVTVNPRIAAQPWYIAQVIPSASSAQLDTAILRIVTDSDGKQMTGCMNEPIAVLGDSDALQMSDRLTMYGYPSVGGSTLTVTSGEVSGFESSGMIKTDAEIGPGSSGGGAYNERGELIGIPSAGRTDTASGARLGLIIPINVVKPLLAQVAISANNACSLTLDDFRQIEQRHKAILNDYFQTRRSWPEYDSVSGRKQLIDNVYAFTLKQPNVWLAETWSQPLGNSSIVQLEVNFPQPGPGYTAGIVFDALSRESRELMTFRISSNGWWGYDVYTAAGWDSTNSMHWQNVNQLIVPNGTNMLWIVRTPTEVQFWLNSKHLGTLNRPAPITSYIGMIAHSHADFSAPSRVQFDNLRVHVPRS